MMSLLNQHDIWPIARFNNYKFGILCTSIITLFSILGFLYLNGENLNLNFKSYSAVSRMISKKYREYYLIYLKTIKLIILIK